MSLPQSPPAWWAGRWAWRWQRWSAIGILVLVAIHFILQHASPATVSTHLTVAHRLHQKEWQWLYGILLLLALSHALVGVAGICREWFRQVQGKPRRWFIRFSLMLVFAVAVLGVDNLVHAPDPQVVKAHQALVGLGAHQKEDQELRLLAHYLRHCTVGGGSLDLRQVFGDAGTLELQGAAFDTWALSNREQDLRRDPGCLFPTLGDFCRWAVAVRKADAQARAKADPDRQKHEVRILQRLRSIQTYSGGQR